MVSIKPESFSSYPRYNWVTMNQQPILQPSSPLTENGERCKRNWFEWDTFYLGRILDICLWKHIRYHSVHFKQWHIVMQRPFGPSHHAGTLHMFGLTLTPHLKLAAVPITAECKLLHKIINSWCNGTHWRCAVNNMLYSDTFPTCSSWIPTQHSYNIGHVFWWYVKSFCFSYCSVSHSSSS